MSSFRNSIVQVLSGSVVSQLVIICSTPLLTRIFDPEVFGVFAYFSGIYAALAAVSTLKYDQAIVVAKSEEEAERLSFLTLGISILFSLFLLVYVLSFQKETFWFFLPACIVFCSIHSINRQWSARAQAYKVYSRCVVIGAFINVTSVMAISLLSHDWMDVLVAGFTLGLFATVILNLLWMPVSRDKIIKGFGGSFKGLREVFKKYGGFPVYVLPVSFLVGSLGFGPPLIIGESYSNDVLGHYAVAAKFVMIPSVIVGGAVTEAFRAELMSKIKKGEDVFNFCRFVFLNIFIFSFIGYLAIGYFSVYVFGFVFGDSYRSAGDLGRALSLSGLAILISQPMAAIFVCLKRTRLALILEALRVGGSLLVLFFMSSRFGIKDALLAYSFVLFVFSLGLSLSALYISSHKISTHGY